MMQFIKEDDLAKIEFEISDDSTLDDVCLAFKYFLMSCGYSISSSDSVYIAPFNDEEDNDD